MGRKLLALVAFVCLSVAGVSAQSLVIHGNGDPRTLTPVPNCASARFYVDDSTQKLYIAALGSPCTWTDSALAETAASYGPILNPMSGSTMFTYVAPASSSYRFCGFIGVVTGATTGTNSYMYVTFTQDGHSQTAINPTMGTPTTQWSMAQNCTEIYADAGTTITGVATSTALTGSPSFRIWATLERLI